MKRKLIAVGTIGLLVLLQLFAAGAALAQEGLQKPLQGKYLSVMGDSISTYMGWSDKRPITSEECEFRYGEPYYGPVGSGCHNEELLVNDTWWHQAAQELGMQILMSNAGNSSGVICWRYPSIPAWERYLKDMRASQSRPYYLGVGGKQPDVVALYIGSADVGRCRISEFGSVEQINFDELIVSNADGTFTYADPQTVAEGYSIMLHKIRHTYPNAEIYCFTVVPNSGGNLETINKRLKANDPFNEMLKGVAEHYNAIVVDIFEAFNLDPNGDGVAVQQDLDTFKSYFNGDPHPNAEGFDVITKCFVDTVLQNSRYIGTVEVETTAGNLEEVMVEVAENGGVIEKKAKESVTASGMRVNYQGFFSEDGTSASEYHAVDPYGVYWARGGSSEAPEMHVPAPEIEIPLMTTDDPATAQDETSSIYTGEAAGRVIVGGDDPRTDPHDGIYDYTETVIQKQARLGISTQALTVKENPVCDEYQDMTYLHSDRKATADNHMITGVKPLSLPEKPEEVPPIEEGFHYVYLGSDQFSRFYAAHDYTVAGDPDEEPFYQDDQIRLYRDGVPYATFKNRNLTLPRIYLKHKTVEVGQDGLRFPARYDSVQQFTLASHHAQLITTYCADQTTATVNGHSYRMENLQDATYYSSAEAKMIHAIALKGYWGTQSGVGSLQELKNRLAATGNFTSDELARLTDGIAITATQYAIWTYSNIMDNNAFVNAYLVNATKPGTAFRDADKADTDLLFKVYFDLISQPPVTVAEPTTENTLINEKNFLRKAAIQLNHKPMEKEENQDEDEDNDVYVGDLAFELQVKPDTARGDDLTMHLYDGDSLVAVGRIAGTLQPGEVQLVSQDGNRYVFSDVLLREGSHDIRFEMKGSQQIGEAAYLFTSEVKGGVPSQTMVGIARGKRNVNVTMDVAFSLAVNDEQVLQRRLWRTEGTTSIPKTGDPFHPALWLGAAAGSLASGLFALKHPKKRRTN